MYLIVIPDADILYIYLITIHISYNGDLKKLIIVLVILLYIIY